MVFIPPLFDPTRNSLSKLQALRQVGLQEGDLTE